MQDPEELISKDEICRILNINDKMFTRLTNNDRFPKSFRVGRKPHIRKIDFVDWANSTRTLLQSDYKPPSILRYEQITSVRDRHKFQWIAGELANRRAAQSAALFRLLDKTDPTRSVVRLNVPYTAAFDKYDLWRGDIVFLPTKEAQGLVARGMADFPISGPAAG